MRFGRAFAVCLFFFSLSPAFADEVVTAQKAVSGDALLLQDGRVLRLAGIKGATSGAKDFLDSLVAGRALVLQDGFVDRYGRVDATAGIQGEVKSLQDVLLREGMAYVYPVAIDERLDAWFEAERAARSAKRGFWAEQKDVSSENAAILLGKFGFVSGVVTKAERIKNKVYLSFGAQGHPDFTIVIAARHLRPLKKLGVDALTLEGKTLRVRGWVSDSAGPTVTIATPQQIEIEK
jgi:micrococcal nuclease